MEFVKINILWDFTNLYCVSFPFLNVLKSNYKQRMTNRFLNAFDINVFKLELIISNKYEKAFIIFSDFQAKFWVEIIYNDPN